MNKKKLTTLLLTGILILSGCNAQENKSDVDSTSTKELVVMRENLPTAEEILANVESTYSDYDFKIVDVYEHTSLSKHGENDYISVFLETTPSINTLYEYRVHMNPEYDEDRFGSIKEDGVMLKELSELLPSDTLFTPKGDYAYTKEVISLQDVKRIFSSVGDIPQIFSGISDEQYNMLQEETVDCGGIPILKCKESDIDRCLGMESVIFPKDCRIISVSDSFAGEQIYYVSIADDNGIFCAVDEKTSDFYQYTTKTIDGVEMLMEYHENTDNGSFYGPWGIEYNLAWEDIPDM